MARRVGAGDFSYEVDERWGQLPATWHFVDVVGVVVDDADRVYVFNRGARPMIVFERDGRFVDAWGAGQFKNPHGLQIDAAGHLYTVDTVDHTVRKWTRDGELLLTLGTPGVAAATGFAGSLDSITGGGPFNAPTNVAIAPNGDIYVSDGYGNCKVHQFSPTGDLIRSWGEPGTGPGQFRLVHGIVVAPDGTVYVGDRANDRVQVFGPTGEYLREWADVRQPDEVHLGPDGRFYVAELGYQEVRDGRLGGRATVRDEDGAILSAWGDEGDPTEAGNLASPHGIRVDSQGDVYVGEVTYTSRVRAGVLPPSCHVFQKFVRVR